MIVYMKSGELWESSQCERGQLSKHLTVKLVKLIFPHELQAIGTYKNFIIVAVIKYSLLGSFWW